MIADQTRSGRLVPKLEYKNDAGLACGSQLWSSCSPLKLFPIKGSDLCAAVMTLSLRGMALAVLVPDCDESPTAYTDASGSRPSPAAISSSDFSISPSVCGDTWEGE
jgi:hypothetical protein